MSDVMADDTGDTETDTPEPVKDFEVEANKWKALARKHEQQAKANADAATRLKEMEHAGKSETEKLQAMLEEARNHERAATIKALKVTVAADKGLPPGLAKFLPDLADEVEMLQAADELLEAASAASSAAMANQPTRQPKSTLTNPLKDDNDAAAQREALLASMMGQSTS